MSVAVDNMIALSAGTRGALSPRIADAEAELARLGRRLSQARLRLGELLDALAASGGHHELGFSSLAAYGQERCGRSTRWCRDTRGLARRVRERGLVGIRRALLSGRLTWSMAELLVRHARPEDEDELLDEASRRNLRQMQAWLTERSGEPVRPGSHAVSEEDVRSIRAVPAHELLMVEASRMVVAHLNGARAGDEALMTALLGEAETNLHAIASAQGRGVDLESATEAFAQSFEGLVTFEPSAESVPRTLVVVEVAEDSPLPEGPWALDREIRECSRRLAGGHLCMGRWARVVLASGAWRAFGYRSPQAYARDRVGVSLSTLEHRITLAKRCARHPQLGVALESGVIGYEAALTIGRVLGRRPSSSLVEAWMERARRRTVVHLREEVDAVLLCVGLDASASREPPSDEDLAEAAELERRVQSGELFRSLLGSSSGPQMSVTLRAAEPGTGASRALRLTLPAELHAHWAKLEREFHRIAGPSASFVSFMCLSLWSTWLPFLEAWDDKWKSIYRRDRHRCTSPVCARHDVTPHHLRFQAHGGGHEPENVTTLCSWCHLRGIHEGRLQAEPPASRIRWTIGRTPVMTVEGREKVLVS